MDQRFFHGNFSTEDLADCLIIHFNRGNLKVQKIGQDQKVAVQIATYQWHSAGGDTALSVFFKK